MHLGGGPTRTRTHARARPRHWLNIDSNLSFRGFVTCIHLFIASFIWLFIIPWTDFLFICEPAFPRGEWGNIHLLMRAVINSEQARPSLPLSGCLFLSARQADSPPSFLPLSQSVSSVFSRPSQSQHPPVFPRPSLLQSLHFVAKASAAFCVSEAAHTEPTNCEKCSEKREGERSAESFLLQLSGWTFTLKSAVLFQIHFSCVYEQ